jgi:hypothetical protein
MSCRSSRLKVNRLLYTQWDNSRARGQFSRGFTWLVCRLCCHWSETALEEITPRFPQGDFRGVWRFKFAVCA